MTASEPPSGYLRCLEAMAEAARVWIQQHPFAGPLQFTAFEKDVAREAGRPDEEKVAIVALLSDVIDRWAANADTRSFLEALVAASNGEATFVQARALVDQLIGLMIERGSGQLAKGNWACVGCGSKNDGFTNTDGDTKRPGPGAMSVCAYCGAFQCVNETADGYDALSTQEFNRLPKKLRMQLHTLRKHVLDTKARQTREREKIS